MRTAAVVFSGLCVGTAIPQFFFGNWAVAATAALLGVVAMFVWLALMVVECSA